MCDRLTCFVNALSLGLLIVCTKRTSVFFLLFVSVNNSVLFYFYFVIAQENTSIKRKTVRFFSASVLEIERIGLHSRSQP